MRVRKLLSLIINFLAVGFAIAGLICCKDLPPISFIKYFTLLTASFVIVSGSISIGYSVEALIKKDKEYVLPTSFFVLKLITSVSAMVTFLTVVTYLQYTVYLNFGINTLEFWQNITLHYVSTLLFVAGFIFFDIDRKYSFELSFFGIAILVVYMLYSIPFSNLGLSFWGNEPYDFMSFKTIGWWSLLLVPAYLIGGLLLSFALWLLNRISYLIFIGEEIKEDEEETEEEKEAEEKVKVTPEDENEVNEVIKTGYTGPRIYHISKRDDKMWQVKFANGKKAIKLFNTQAEAIVFAKKLAKSQEGSIRVHSLKGKIRKAH